jgi:type I restriction enzyme R subunit
MNEAETCRQYVVSRLVAAGWATDPRSFTEQDSFTDGRIVVAGGNATRQPQKRTDYLLRYTRDYPLAVVEAKAAHKTPGTGLQQAKDYADLLGLKFAYATNGAGIVEFDYLTGEEREIATFPTPGELWARLRGARPLGEAAAGQLLTPVNHQIGKGERYYQRLAINRVVEAILAGQERVLLTMATGTGKTVVAFQICWKLWNGLWNREGSARRPRILFLADRNILVDDPKDKTFAPFGDARFKIEGGAITFGRQVYFATYQALAADERRPGRYREFARDFFDLIVIDECHRGSAKERVAGGRSWSISRPRTSWG